MRRLGARLCPSRLRARFCSSDAFHSGWTLPFRQEPWALPFSVTQQEALHAFLTRHDNDDDPGPKLTLRSATPRHVPFYVFEGVLQVSFTGIVGYDDGADTDAATGVTPATEYMRQNIGGAPIPLGADQGTVSAVYAGFGFRRFFVRQALSGSLSEELLARAVPLTHLEAALPAGCRADDFEMKPSFAFRERLLERLPEVAHYWAEQRMSQTAARSLAYWNGEERRSPAEAAPDYDRVEEVTHELLSPKLHDRGVIVLPVWAVEYACLGKRYRAFVSGLEPTNGLLPTVSGMAHRNPWAASGSAWAADTGDTAARWRLIGLMRQTDAEANTDWRVQRYWLDEVSRVMPEGQKATFKPGGAGSGGFRSFVPGGASVSDEDYELLGLKPSPPPSAAAIRQAFRKACMQWHPDKQVDKTDDERAASHERFQRIVDAHNALRERHPEYLDGVEQSEYAK